MGVDAPEWLFTSFEASMQEIGATASTSELRQEAQCLLTYWSTAGEQKRTLRHLVSILTHIDELSSLTYDADVLCVAAWYFGAAFHIGLENYINGSDPAETAVQCTYFTREHLRALGVSEEVSTRVLSLIKMTALQSPPSDDVDAEVLSDANLAFLASTPQEYKKQRAQVREEYSSLNDLDFCRLRRLFVQHLLSKRTIFHLQQTSSWEAQARENLTGELARLNATIHSLDPSEAAMPSSRDDDITDGDNDLDDLQSIHTGNTYPETHGGEEAQRPHSGAVIIRHQRLRKTPATPEHGTVKSEGSSNKLPTLNPAHDHDTQSADRDASDDASSLETAPDVF